MSTQPSKIDTESSVFRLFIVGGLVLLVLFILVACTALGFFFVRGTPVKVDTAGQQKAAETVATSFINDLKTGNAQAAYQKTTKRYQAEQSPSAFEAKVGQQGWMSSYKEQGMKGGSFGGAGFSFQATLMNAE